jgi:hypothetical protein
MVVVMAKGVSGSHRLRGRIHRRRIQRPLLRCFTPQSAQRSLSRRLQGALRSPTFIISNRYLHILAAGRESRINVPVDNLTMIRDPIYGGLKKVMNHDELKWITVDVDMWKGHKAYLEFSDISTPDPSDDGHKDGFSPTGWIAVSRIVFSEQASLPSWRIGKPAAGSGKAR